jgi:hypothetical protein
LTIVVPRLSQSEIKIRGDRATVGCMREGEEMTVEWLGGWSDIDSTQRDRPDRARRPAVDDISQPVFL